MANYLEIPILSPLNWVDKNRALPANYHFKHIDAWKSNEQVLPLYSAFDWKQKWQKNDIIVLPAKSNFGPVNVKIFNEYNDLVADANMSSVGSIGEDTFWLLSVNLAALEEGCYYLETSAGEGDSKLTFESEWIDLKEDQPGTLLYKFWHDSNNTIFWEAVSYITLRMEGEIKEYEGNGIRKVYNDQPNTAKTIKGITSRQFKLYAGTSLGIPDPYADKLQEIFDQNNVEIDGKGFSGINNAARFIPNRADLYAFAGWSMDITETSNRRTKRLESTGLVDKKIVMDVFATSKFFGPVNNEGSAEDTTYYIKTIG